VVAKEGNFLKGENGVFIVPILIYVSVVSTRKLNVYFSGLFSDTVSTYLKFLLVIRKLSLICVSGS